MSRSIRETPVRAPVFTKLFSNDGNEFSAYSAADRWARAAGFATGSMQRDAPIALFKGEVWKEQVTCDGTIRPLSGSFRHGDAIVTLYVPHEEPPDDAKPEHLEREDAT